MVKAFVWGNQFAQKPLKEEKNWITLEHEQDILTEDDMVQVKKVHARQKLVNDYKKEQQRIVQEKLLDGNKNVDIVRNQKDLDKGILTTDFKGAPIRTRKVTAEKMSMIVND